LITTTGLCTTLLLATLPARAQVQNLITFDDLNPSPNPIVQNGYQGLTWTNFGVVNSQQLFNAIGPNGFTNGTVSSPNVVTTLRGGMASIDSPTPFTLDSLDLSGAWNNDLSVTLSGFNPATPLFITQTFVVNATGPTHISPGWAGITTFTILSTGGTNAGFTGSGPQCVLDNLLLTQQGDVSGAPEPGAIPLLAGPITLILACLCRRRRI